MSTFVDTSIVLSDTSGKPVCGANFWIRRTEPNNEFCGASNFPDGFASGWIKADEPGLPQAMLTVKAKGYKDISQPIQIHSGMGMIRVTLESVVNPTNPVLQSALCIIGNYPFGKNPNTPNNVFFMDELDNIPDWWTRILDDYQARGYTTIHVGPVVAKAYHGYYPDTNWLGNPEGFKVYLRELRRRGLRINLVLLPDVAPYYNGRDGWNWDAVNRDLTPFYSDPEILALCEEFQLEWECVATNAEYVTASKWARGIIGPQSGPTNRRLRYHSPPDHSAPGLSSEPISEAQMWQNVIAAGCSGWALQNASRALPDGQRNEAGRLPLEQFTYDIMDAIRHSDGSYGGWNCPQMIDALWIMEYMAYFMFWDGYTEAQAREWGAAAVVTGAVGYGDSGPTA